MTISAGERKLTGTPIWLALVISVFFGVFWLSVADLEALPTPWWDEGWALCVARTWVEEGHYGCKLNGELAGPNLPHHFPVVILYSLGFYLWGVGFWQARLVGVLLTYITLAGLFWLSRKIYHRKVAIATVGLCIFLPLKWEISALVMGRQVLGEIPALLYLLAGYGCFHLAFRRPVVFLCLAAVFWGLALEAKEQVPPFWAVSLAVPLVMALARRQWRIVGMILVVGVGSMAMYVLVNKLVTFVRVQSITLSLPTVLNPAIQRKALVLDPDIRQITFRFLWNYGWPTLAALAYALIPTFFNRRQPFTPKSVLRLMLATLAASWFGWYVILSIGHARYAMPGLFLGMPFLAAGLHDLTGGFDFKGTIRNVTQLLQPRGWRQGLPALGGLLLCGLLGWYAVRDLKYFPDNYSEPALRTDVLNYVNTVTAPGSLIETWESELLFQLDRPYHYPIRAKKYDPLAADPDYLVLGSFTRYTRQIYRRVLKGDEFQLVFTNASYDIYQRVRQAP